MKIIQTRQGVGVKVSNEDFELLSQFSWNFYDRYVESRIENKTTKIHRFILDAKDHEHVDHINGDTLDNRRSNLRICNRFQNQHNRKLNKNSSTGKKGVKLLPNGRYRARVQANGIRYHLGCFDTVEEAFMARNKKAKELHNEFFREK